MQAKVDSTWQQAADTTQQAVQAQSVVQFASTTMSAYEAEMNEVQRTVEQLQQLIISERNFQQQKARLVLWKDVINCWKIKMCNWKIMLKSGRPRWQKKLQKIGRLLQIGVVFQFLNKWYPVPQLHSQ